MSLARLPASALPEDRIRFWLGHANKSITDVYSKLKKDVTFRKKGAEQVGIELELSIEQIWGVTFLSFYSRFNRFSPLFTPTGDTHNLLSNRAASFSDWRFPKKSLHGAARRSRFAKFPMLKSEGISAGLTSDHSNGVEMGAFSRRRTE